MCRIIGLVDNRSKKKLSKKDIEILITMRDSMSDGGPDDFGLFEENNVGLGHRRLSIIDLTDSGKQPMIFENWVISFNGEIYNYKEIKKKLIKCNIKFSTDTDTEVIVKAIDYWGIKAINKFHGMFAFALWNRISNKLLLCRDRLGVKPLHWYLKDDLLLFSSEIKGFHSHPDFDNEINLKSIPHFFKKGYIKPTESIFKYVNKVVPGTVIEFTNNLKYNVKKYWDIDKIFNKTIINFSDKVETEKRLKKVLISSFNYRMVSDVPVGIFLSGGIDSSLVASILQSKKEKPIKTFTIGFKDDKFNESKIAEEISKILGTDHKTYYCDEKDFKKIIPKLSNVYDEPFGDSSAIPTCLICELASKEIKVVLSGDGGDELFGGYSKYHFTSYSNIILSIPLPIRRIIYNLSFLISGNLVEKISRLLNVSSFGQIANKYSKFQNTLLSTSVDDFFERASSYISNEKLQLLTNSDLKQDLISKKSLKNRLMTYLGLIDMKNYLSGDILVKVDRASMSVGLEAREPFLDQDLIKFSMSISDNFKYNRKENGKVILKNILKNYLPENIINRPKQGFSVPIEKWMRNILKDILIEISNDITFFKKFNLNITHFKYLINSFFVGKNKVDPYVIWFLFVLHNWYKKWILQ